jgi:hypothetical protein
VSVALEIGDTATSASSSFISGISLMLNSTCQCDGVLAPATIAVPETLDTTDSTEPPTGTAETDIIIDTITEPRRSTRQHMPRVYVSEGMIASNDETLPAWAVVILVAAITSLSLARLIAPLQNRSGSHFKWAVFVPTNSRRWVNVKHYGPGQT